MAPLFTPSLTPSLTPSRARLQSLCMAQRRGYACTLPAAHEGRHTALGRASRPALLVWDEQGYEYSPRDDG